MVDDVDTAQARNLLQDLYGQIAKLTFKLDVAISRNRRLSTRGAMIQHRQLSVLRRELHEAHRLIDGIHHRFPDALPTGMVQQLGVHQGAPGQACDGESLGVRPGANVAHGERHRP